MEYRNLGNSGIKVSNIGLGGNNFGFRVNEQETIAIVHKALDLGINFIDTANWYSQRGLSEKFIGSAIKGKRLQVILATKFGFNMGEGPNEQGGSRYHLINAVEDSLKRLGTDYIDLYQMHRPDPTTPIEETLWTLDKLVRDGKVRYIACSNFAAWQISEAVWTSRGNNWMAFITAQVEYNLLKRDIEKDLVPCCLKHKLGIIPWGPLAGGFLSGQYQRAETAPKESRVAQMPIYQPLFNQANFDKMDKLKAFAEERGHTLPELAISWLLAHPFVSTLITGATKVEQIAANVDSANWKLTAEELNTVNQLTGDAEEKALWGDKAQRK